MWKSSDKHITWMWYPTSGTNVNLYHQRLCDNTISWWLGWTFRFSSLYVTLYHIFTFAVCTTHVPVIHVTSKSLESWHNDVMLHKSGLISFKLSQNEKETPCRNHSHPNTYILEWYEAHDSDTRLHNLGIISFFIFMVEPLEGQVCILLPGLSPAKAFGAQRGRQVNKLWKNEMKQKPDTEWFPESVWEERRG